MMKEDPSFVTCQHATSRKKNVHANDLPLNSKGGNDGAPTRQRQPTTSSVCNEPHCSHLSPRTDKQTRLASVAAAAFPSFIIFINSESVFYFLSRFPFLFHLSIFTHRYRVISMIMIVILFSLSLHPIVYILFLWFFILLQSAKPR